MKIPTSSLVYFINWLNSFSVQRYSNLGYYYLLLYDTYKIHKNTSVLDKLATLAATQS